MGRKATRRTVNGGQSSGSVVENTQMGGVEAHVEEQGRQIRAHGDALDVLTRKLDTMADYLRSLVQSQNRNVDEVTSDGMPQPVDGGSTGNSSIESVQGNDEVGERQVEQRLTEGEQKREFKGKLPKVDGEGIEKSLQITHLIGDVERLRKHYNDDSLLLHLREKIGSKMTVAIDPKNEMTLAQMIEKLKARFNSSERLEEEVARLVNFKLNEKYGKAEAVQEFMDLGQLINSRYEQLGREYMRWSTTRLINHLIRYILPREKEFTRELSRRWTQLSEMERENMSSEKIRVMVASVEDHLFLWDGPENGSITISAIQNGRQTWQSLRKRKMTCWQCGDDHEVPPGKLIRCANNKIARCETCKGPHMTKFHYAAHRTGKGSNTQGSYAEKDTSTETF